MLSHATRAKLDEIDRQIDAKAAERAQAKATIAKVDAALPIAEERDQIYEKLRENEYSSKVAALEAKEQLVEAQHDHAVAIHQVEQADADIAGLKQQRQGADEDFRRQAMDDLAKAKQKAAEQRDEQVKAVQKTGLQTLRAPIDGTIEQLSVHTIGGVVTPAQSLMVLVPDGTGLTVEAMLPNREVGFVHAGQEAEVKVEAFNYTRYGLLKGTVEGVSRDALRTADRDAVNEQDEDPTAATRAKRANEPGTEESAYVARVALARTDIDTEMGHTALAPGMAVTAEIKTGQRRLIEYLLSPLMRFKHEGLRER